MGDSDSKKPRVGKLSPMEIAVSGAVVDMVKFFTDLDIVRGIIPYQDAKARDRIRAYNEMIEIQKRYSKYSSLIKRLEEAKRYVTPYLGDKKK